MNILNVVSNINRINMGVWKAALVGARYLAERGVRTLLLVCDGEESQAEVPELLGVEIIFLPKTNWRSYLATSLALKSLSPSNTVVVTHGSWLLPTKIGKSLSRKSYKWVYVPQGMLEPWSMKQNRFKKNLYFSLIEGPLVNAASAIRAVSFNEKSNLEQTFKIPVTLIENGVIIPPHAGKRKGPSHYLFMARLHSKKGLLPFVKIWSSIMKTSDSLLYIAGPDEGELSKISPFLGGNVQYLGPVYGEAKERLLKEAHYFVLPSFSEGLPSSVLEAMSYGVVPVISIGCNLPEVFRNNLGYQIEPDENSIIRFLNHIKTLDFDEQLSERNRTFIMNNYSDDRIGQKLYNLYRQLLPDSGL